MRAATVLAIDTATEHCSVALLIDDLRYEASEAVGQRHSQRALPLVDQVMGRAAVTVSELDVIAFGAGPGSFTGVRIACGIAQGLAFGAGKPVVPIVNLRALAARALAQVEGEVVLAAIDARMNQAYCAIFRRGAEVSEVRRPALTSPAHLVDLAREYRADIVAGNALVVFADAWPPAPGWQALPNARSDALDIALLARIDAGLGRAVDPAAAAPLYVRDQVAFTTEERRARNLLR